MTFRRGGSHTVMLTEPVLERRAEQAYVAIPAQTTMDALATTLPPLLPELFDWLARRGVAPAGAPLFRYLVIDMEGDLEMEVGVPVASPVAGDERVRARSLPEGRYLTAIHTGPYHRLVEATGELLACADRRSLGLAVESTPAGEAWQARTEHYLTDPGVEPDPERWQTELAFLTAP
jgi:effector-binding domain-containing protein